ncbi:MAG: NAD(P)H-hydrate epimerase [Ekhidna sp.]|nr:NAD(P)H-hydrate epimerase [Ekhidna sp.]
MKVLSAQQIREADAFTIVNEPIASIDLMERASNAFVDQFQLIFKSKSKVYIFAGTGNNGGDALAIARILSELKWECDCYVVGNLEKGSNDFKINLSRLDKVQPIHSARDFPELLEGEIVIDGMFGSGLSRPLEGLSVQLIEYLNNTKTIKVSIDIASGLFADKSSTEGAIAFQPNHTFSFQLPKLVFFLPENEKLVGKFHVLPIGLDESFIEEQETAFHFLESKDVSGLIPLRKRFTHKKEVGSLRIIGGSKGMIGAVVLATKAAIQAGVGLVDVCVPSCGLDVMQLAVPEAMVLPDEEDALISSIAPFAGAMVIGPGMSTQPEAVLALEKLLQRIDQPIVLDADAINIVARNPELVSLLPKESILTPHPGEFKRLAGDSQQFG